MEQTWLKLREIEKIQTQTYASLTIFEIFNDKCDSKVNMNLNDLQTKVKVNFGTNRFLIYDFL